jgi:hypothetical protein
MPTIWCAISSHGYGHAAQMVPVLNELGQRIPELRAILRTQVPPSFFSNRLSLPHTLSPMAQDVGCIQDGPLSIDITRTWDEHGRFHDSWEARLGTEVRAIQEARPALVLSDISPLAIAAARRTGVPAAAVGSLTWDVILEPYMSQDFAQRHLQTRILDQIRGAYAQTDVMIRLSPGLPMPTFPLIKDVGPLVQPVTQDRNGLRKSIGATAREHVAVIAFGGVPLQSLPIPQMEAMEGWQFVMSGTVPAGCRRVRSAETLPFPFGKTLVSADVILTKPGYSTVVEAVRHQVPVLYVRRYDFADEEGLVRYLHRHGRGLELDRTAFMEGQWAEALADVLRQPAPPETAPEPWGAADAAELLAGYFL